MSTALTARAWGCWCAFSRISAIGVETCACALRPSSCESCFSATKLDSVFLVYTSDYNAIASFFVRSVPGEERREFAATVLFFDLSNDLCAFARSVLGQHGYEVLTTTSFSDAHLLAQAAQPSVILLGHEAAGLEACTVVPTLQAAAPRAATVTLRQTSPRATRTKVRLRC